MPDSRGWVESHCVYNTSSNNAMENATSKNTCLENTSTYSEHSTRPHIKTRLDHALSYFPITIKVYPLSNTYYLVSTNARGTLVLALGRD